MKKIVLLFVSIFSFCFAFAKVTPSANLSTYYSAANGKSGDAIRTSLQDAIDDHTIVDYDELKTLFIYSDTRENAESEGDYVIDIYSNCTYPPGSAFVQTSHGCGGYNREHSVPKSWFNDASPMYSDAFHLYPTSAYVNSYRGNDPLGECANGVKCTTNGMTEALGRRGSCTYPGYSGTVYEPDDKYKGDLARTYFYMATRYTGSCENWSGNMFGRNNNGFATWAINMLLEWHRKDPVSEKELIRNEAIYGNTTYNTSSYKQGNRNPFIDFPCLAEYIWGKYKGQTVDFSKLFSAYSDEYALSTDKSGCECEPNTSITITPSTISFETYDATETLEEEIWAKGENLTSNVTLRLSGSDKFSLTKTSLSANEVNAGTNVRVTYSPAEIGQSTATLIVASGSASDTIYIVGKCMFEALAATDLTQNSFVANWTNAGTDNYSLDVYTKNVTGTTEVVLLEDECNKATTATTSGSVNYDIEGCVRLGASSKTGAITYSNLDLSKGGKVIVNAQYYKNDSGTEMKISAGDVSETFTITSDFVDYELVVPANEANTSVDLVVESLASKKRINVNNVQVITGGAAVGKVSVVGYPKTVGKVQSYLVESVDYTVGDYYYTVTPQNLTVSNEILVSAEGLEQSGVEEVRAFDMRNYLNGNCLIIEDVAPESVLTLMTTSGVILERTVALQSTARFTLPMHGVYLVRIETNGNSLVLKTIY